MFLYPVTLILMKRKTTDAYVSALEDLQKIHTLLKVLGFFPVLPLHNELVRESLIEHFGEIQFGRLSIKLSESA